jgi:hypothetical protein
MSITQHTAQGKPYHKPKHMQKAGGVVGIWELPLGRALHQWIMGVRSDLFSSRDKSNSTQHHTGLAQQSGFGTAVLLCTFCWGWWKAQQSLTLARKECNKCDLTASPYFGLADQNDWFRWFANSSLAPICSLSFSFVGEVGKK